MQPMLVGGLVTLMFAIVLFMILRQTASLMNKEADLSPILTEIRAAKECHIQTDRSVREEISRNREEHSGQSQALRGEVAAALNGIGESVSIKVEGLTRSNDQKFELLRSGMELRLDSISGESMRKMDLLTQSAATSGGFIISEFAKGMGEHPTGNGHIVEPGGGPTHSTGTSGSC